MDTYRLSNETIDLLSDKIGAMYEEHGCSKKETLRAKLLLEEALLKYRTRFGEDTELTYRIYRVLNQTRFTIRIRTGSFDPFTLEENPMAFMIQTILSNFEGSMPTWKYQNMENELVFTLRKKAAHSTMFTLVTALLSSVILGILLRLLVPQAGLAAFVNDYLNPLADAYAGLFCIMAAPITLFAIVLSIVHIGDATVIGALGGRILKRFYVMIFLLVAVLTLPLLPLFDLSGQGELSIVAKSFYDILIGFIPNNIVAPFLNFNSVHIMIVGAMFGFSLLAMGQKGESVVRLFDECNMVAISTNSFLNRFIFLYVALKTFAAVTLSEFTALRSAASLVAVTLIGEVLLLVFYTLRVCRKTGVSVTDYCKKSAPPFMVALSSSNFGAAVNTLIDFLLSFGVSEGILNLGLNLGSIVFQPGATYSIIVGCLFMARTYHVEISLLWVVTALLFSIILVASVPNVPGAVISVYTLLFVQLGIPAEALAVMITLNAVLQFLVVPVDVWCLSAEILCLNADEKKAA